MFKWQCFYFSFLLKYQWNGCSFDCAQNCLWRSERLEIRCTFDIRLIGADLTRQCLDWNGISISSISSDGPVCSSSPFMLHCSTENTDADSTLNKIVFCVDSLLRALVNIVYRYLFRYKCTNTHKIPVAVLKLYLSICWAGHSCNDLWIYSNSNYNSHINNDSKYCNVPFKHLEHVRFIKCFWKKSLMLFIFRITSILIYLKM